MSRTLRFLLQLYASAAIGVVYALGLAWFGLGPRMDAAGWAFFLCWILVATVLAFGVGVPGFALLLRPLDQIVDRVRRGTESRWRERLRMQRRALNLPVALAVFTFLLWLGPLLTLPLAAVVLPDAPDWGSLVLAFVSTLGIGVVHATFVLYLGEREARRRYVPELLPLGQVRQVPRVRPASVGLKLGLLFGTTALFPIFIFTVMVLLGTATVSAALFLTAASLLLGVAQSWLIQASVNRPVERLQHEMALVRRGELDTRATVESADEMGLLTEGFNEMVAGLEEAEFVKETFGRYVAPAVRDEILSGEIKFGGERREASILFTDIRGFTAFSEPLPPEQVVEFLNRYLDRMVEILVTHGATIDKFIGDAIVATFGVPVAQDDHALRAVSAAVEMSKSLDAYNAERWRGGEPPMEIGIGVHSGEVLAGNIGSARRMEYTVIGDTVNTASRIEGLTKRFGVRVLISAATHALVSEHVEARACEPTKVRGKQEPIVVYEVAGLWG